jgi:small multidrug resistance pump
MAWLFLIGAIVSEVAGTLSLRMAVNGGKSWYIAVACGYLLAFVLLTYTLRGGIGIGIAYGVWAATGVALTATASRILFKEPLTRVMMLGIGCIIAGVLLVELGTSH